MKVLAIGLDRRIAASNPALNEPQQRQAAYAKKLEKFTIICKTPDNSEYQKRQLADNLTVLPSLSKQSWRFLLDAYKLGCQILNAEHFDLITTQDPFYCGPVGYLLARKYKLPLNIQLHSDIIDNPHWLTQNWLHYLLNWLGKKVIKRADSVRVVSEEIKNDLQRRGIAAKRIFVCPIGIETELFSNNDNRQMLRSELGLSDDTFLVLSVGRLVAAKDYPTLISAAKLVAKEFPPVKFIIIGEGREKSRLEELIFKNDLVDTVILPGNVDYEKLPDYYAACDIFLMTSTYEGFPRVLVEAAAASRPIVSTAISGAISFVTPHKSGLIAAVGNSFELANHISLLLNDPKLRKTMGEQAQKQSKDFHFSKTVEKLTEGWQKTHKL